MHENLKDKIEQELSSVAEQTIQNPVPDARIFFATLTHRLLDKSEPITQAQIYTEMKQFRSVSDKLLPHDVVHTYTSNALSCQSSEVMNGCITPLLILKRINAIQRDPQAEPKTTSIEDRKESLTKFTEEEYISFLKFIVQDPKIILTINIFQKLLKKYILEVKNKIPKEYASHRRLLDAMSEHWSAASNLGPALGTTLFYCMNSSDSSEITSETVDSSFDFLQKVDAFAVSLSASRLRLKCPAQAWLIEQLAHKGTFMDIYTQCNKNPHSFLDEQLVRANANFALQLYNEDLPPNILSLLLNDSIRQSPNA